MQLPNDMDALIVTNPYNILYLSGFKGISDTEREAILIVKNKQSILITAKLYREEASKLKTKVVYTNERDTLMLALQQTLKGAQKIGFEEKDLKVSEFNNFKTLLPGKDLIGTRDLIENLRAVKTSDEVKKIEKAQIISQNALALLLKSLKTGQTEQEIAQRLALIVQKVGGEGLSFESIVASGPNSGIPHHKTGNRKIKTGDTLLFDFGAKYQNYCADVTRTVFVGKASDRQVNIYNHVMCAQQNAIEKVQRELKLKDAYNLAYEVFEDAQLHDYFIHGLGHGVGLEVHESPYLRASSKDEDLLQDNMVFSVEPGLYFPWGGVRIEDLVVLQNGKAKVLGNIKKEIIVV
ncbi:aminopeptidase P family protein [Candidatus Curtissbacteria bacterium]|nr:aminopeptidase P family protein [Candidatus Curtissbacteria bacterium]